MGFGKAFGFSLLAYIGLNFLFTIIAFTVLGLIVDLFNSIAANFLTLFVVLLGPVVETPVSAYSEIVASIGLNSPGLIVLSIGYIVSPLISAIIAGKVGENKGGSFGGWFLTCIVMALVIVIFSVTNILDLSPLTEVDAFISGVINGIFYATFTLIFTTTEYY